MRGAYYQHSGRFNPSRLLLVVAASLVVAVVLAFVYAYAFAYLPFVGYVSFILAAGFGFLLGLAVGKGLLYGHVRSAPVAILATLLVTCVAYFASWVVWVHAIAGRGDFDIPILELASSPTLLWNLIAAINDNGVWSMQGWTPTNEILWVFWGLEVVLIFVPALMVSLGTLGRSAYCESCGRWCTDEAAVDLDLADSDEMRQRLEGGDYRVLAELPRRSVDATMWMRVELKVCPSKNCGQTNTLCASTIAMTVDDEGKSSEEATLFVDRLLVDRAIAQQIEG